MIYLKRSSAEALVASAVAAEFEHSIEHNKLPKQPR